jgi:AraC-like DNA-binding protein
LLLPQIEALHGALVVNSSAPGELWELDPGFGNGYFWVYRIDDMMAVTICEIECHESFLASYQLPDFFSVSTCGAPASSAPAYRLHTFGTHGLNALDCGGTIYSPQGHSASSSASSMHHEQMTSYLSPAASPHATSEVLGRVWKRGTLCEALPAHAPRKTVGISLLPDAMQWLGELFRVNPLVLALAISELDGMQQVPGLEGLFDALFAIRPCERMARSYYETKIVEACGLLLDWRLLRRSEQDSSVRSADYSALNVVLRYIHENLEKNITLKELCRLSCMSASKLTVLFKQTKHKSPIEYAKDAKMDYACRLLAEDSASIQEIASRLGFVYQGSFSEAFKGRYGITPRSYRRTHTVERTARSAAAFAQSSAAAPAHIRETGAA